MSPLLADNIDPRTRDFRSLEVGADVVDAQVQVALQVVRGSGASVLNDGMRRAPRKMLDSFSRDIEAEARVALARLVASGDVRLARVKVTDQSSEQTGAVEVRYVNLRVTSNQVRVVVLEG